MWRPCNVRLPHPKTNAHILWVVGQRLLWRVLELPFLRSSVLCQWRSWGPVLHYLWLRIRGRRQVPVGTCVCRMNLIPLGLIHEMGARCCTSWKFPYLCRRILPCASILVWHSEVQCWPHLQHGQKLLGGTWAALGGELSLEKWPGCLQLKQSLDLSWVVFCLNTAPMANPIAYPSTKFNGMRNLCSEAMGTYCYLTGRVGSFESEVL